MMRKSKTIPGMITLLVTVVMLLTLIGSAFATNAQTYNNDESSVYGSIFPTRYSASVTAPVGTTKTEVTATLYQKQLLWYTKVDSASNSANTNYCAVYKNYTMESGKTYKLEIEARVYNDGVWDTLEATTSGSF